MKRASKRNELIKVGKEIVVRQGFKSASLNDILTTAGVPKGSFYYYFSSKDDFGLAIVDDFAQEYRERLETILEDRQHSPLIRLRNYFETKIAEMESCQCSDGCLIGNLAQELSAQNELFRDRLNQVFAEWEQYFVRCLAAADEAGEISGERDLDNLAKFILSSWEGAILQAKVAKSVTPMQTFVDVLFEQVLSQNCT
ncbi:TetR family transcriptional regulator C-terminal domain-containing protein [Pleurocapsales cyanobacterium LEGE 10410]|nr:TetR family transcriptional regulator C-terminal domain-containing protein [Pleurocapsales cyanobacterium LEGE 10410]